MVYGLVTWNIATSKLDIEIDGPLSFLVHFGLLPKVLALVVKSFKGSCSKHVFLDLDLNFWRTVGF